MINNMIMKMRGDKCHPGRGKRGKIPLLPNNVGKKSVNDAGPKQGHDTKQDLLLVYILYRLNKSNERKGCNYTKILELVTNLF